MSHLYPYRVVISFTTKQKSILRKIAYEKELPIAAIVRQAMNEYFLKIQEKEVCYNEKDESN